LGNDEEEENGNIEALGNWEIGSLMSKKGDGRTMLMYNTTYLHVVMYCTVLQKFKMRQMEFN
jgi:hypothetical protein